MNEQDMAMPTSNYIQAKTQQAQSRITVIFDEYKALMRERVHPDNQSPAYEKKVFKTIQRLLTAANELDGVKPGEGIFGLITLSLMTNLRLKDENLKLEKRMRDLEREVKRLKKR